MRNVAVLVDGDFYLKQNRKYYLQSWAALGNAGPAPHKNVEQIAKALVDHCLRHIREGEERFYRIFFYDCSPLTHNVHNPITKELVNMGKTKTAHFRTGLHDQLKRTRNLALRLGTLDVKNARWAIKDPQKNKGTYCRPVRSDNKAGYSLLRSAKRR